MIKLIATDMDGTWLNAEKTYNHELFQKDFKLMQEKNIKFVIASGNQYENLLAYFPENARKQMYFIAENGALVAEGNNILKIDSLSRDLYDLIIRICQTYPYPIIIAGIKSAYILKSAGSDFYNSMTRFYRKIKLIDNLNDIKDQIFKVSLVVPEDKMPKILHELERQYPQIGIVAGGYDSIDFSAPHVTKASGLEFLSKKLNIMSDEMVAFGDSGNDIAMLKYVGKSFVTNTGMTSTKKVADHIIGSSQDSSVQKEIIKLLEN
ncbi:Cof-type HAD-IIB family hydrolase [Lactobacillus sp. PV034]|uniref:Cof-type HAD-IIB family hydrolase n=1 Tax=Lactobacillus sp. PV034 TaxID=2594495 RepID=UPI00223EBFF1|nr:Cof-type HAD-IIB family hydrolase [Lactobacillus sp. PV034]QNQ81268.1 HAD family hydrolase [Lactobacillus sp. PV034]